MWMRSPERYVRQYMLAEANTLNNSGLRYGKKTSEALEGADTEGDDLMDAVVALLPRYELREHEIRVPMKTQHGEVILLGKLDTFGRSPVRFREYKTGRTKWTQAKAEKHKQIPHYGTLVWLFHGKLPDAWLDWAQTEEVDGEVRFTGHLESFHVELTMKDILQYMAIVSKVAIEIDTRYRQELARLA